MSYIYFNKEDGLVRMISEEKLSVDKNIFDYIKQDLTPKEKIDFSDVTKERKIKDKKIDIK
jgi:hypothetical protein